MYVALKITDESYPTYIDEFDVGHHIPLELEECKNFYFVMNTSDSTDYAWMDAGRFAHAWKFTNFTDPNKFNQVVPQ